MLLQIVVAWFELSVLLSLVLTAVLALCQRASPAESVTASFPLLARPAVAALVRWEEGKISRISISGFASFL